MSRAQHTVSLNIQTWVALRPGAVFQGLVREADLGLLWKLVAGSQTSACIFELCRAWVLLREVRVLGQQGLIATPSISGARTELESQDGCSAQECQKMEFHKLLSVKNEIA